MGTDTTRLWQNRNAIVDLPVRPQLCLSPPKVDCIGDQSVSHPQAPTQSVLVPPNGHQTPTIVLLPATEWNFNFDSMLDCSDLTLRDHLNVQLAYLYGYIPDLQERAFAEGLLYEHRQYHFDVVSGMSYGTTPFVTHQRNVLKALRERTCALQECSAARDNEDLFKLSPGITSITSQGT